MRSTDPAYKHYWARKRLLARGWPKFEVIGTSGRALDGRVLDVVKAAIAERTRLLDFGAGDLRVRDMLVSAGFKGTYETLDVGDEFSHTYRSLDETSGTFDAILLLDVIEHLDLRAGLSLIENLFARLQEGGVLVLQTPNGRCVRSPFSSDMTHIHAYNLPDLWAFLSCLGCDAIGYRVVFGDRTDLGARVSGLVARWVATRLLGLDYADNILLVATRKSP